ncbi:MAG TPA: hypothetical protein VJ851_00325 [Jatrophihabitans sp.]|nr:hypothetical protein [Jatrophihabitans sp.]
MTEAPHPTGRRRRRRGRRSAKPAGTEPATTAAPEPARGGSTGRRSTGQASTGQASTDSSEAPADEVAGSAERPGNKGAGRRRPRPAAEPTKRAIRDAERGWRDLVGSGSSQVGVSGALRARDVARPAPADLAEAERTVQLVRRQWRPPPDGS